VKTAGRSHPDRCVRPTNLGGLVAMRVMRSFLLPLAAVISVCGAARAADALTEPMESDVRRYVTV
jgi:hypothetical protein